MHQLGKFIHCQPPFQIRVLNKPERETTKFLAKECASVCLLVACNNLVRVNALKLSKGKATVLKVGQISLVVVDHLSQVLGVQRNGELIHFGVFSVELRQFASRDFVRLVVFKSIEEFSQLRYFTLCSLVLVFLFQLFLSLVQIRAPGG